jgi:hypothetical protein
MPQPLRLTDAQITHIFAAARPLAVRDRDPFLQDVASLLAGIADPGDGDMWRGRSAPCSAGTSTRPSSAGTRCRTAGCWPQRRGRAAPWGQSGASKRWSGYPQNVGWLQKCTANGSMTDDQFMANWKPHWEGKPWPAWPCGGGFHMAKASLPRGPNRFTERELARAVRAAHRAGGVARVEVDLDGKIVLVPKQTDKAAEETPEDLQKLL